MLANSNADKVADADRRKGQYRDANRNLSRKGGTMRRVSDRLLGLRHEALGKINHLLPHIAAQDGANNC